MTVTMPLTKAERVPRAQGNSAGNQAVIRRAKACPPPSPACRTKEHVTCGSGTGRPRAAAHELRVPIDAVEGARRDVILRRVDRATEGLHPIGHFSRPRRSKRRLHHLISHPAKKEGIGALEVRDRMTMQLFVPNPRTVIAAPVQCDVDGITKRSHYARLQPTTSTSQVAESHCLLQSDMTLGTRSDYTTPVQ